MNIIDDSYWEAENTPQERQVVSDMFRDAPDVLAMLGLV